MLIAKNLTAYIKRGDCYIWSARALVCDIRTRSSFINRGYYTVARRYEFYFRVAKQYFTHSLRSFVKYCFCHEKIKFISSSRRVMFFLLYRQNDIDKIIDFSSPKSNRDGSNLQYSNIRHCLQWSSEITLSWIGLYNDKLSAKLWKMCK